MFMNLKRKIDAERAARSDAAQAAIAEAKAAAADLGLRHVIDNGEPRCLFDARGDECVVTIVNVAKFAEAFRAAGFEEERNMFGAAFRFAPVRMAEAAAIVNA
jgi:hypothetical protein